MKPGPFEKAQQRALAPFRNRWTGKTVVCIASGPSLTPEDVEKVRHLPCIVTNTTFRDALWAEVLIAHDSKWWKKYREEAELKFPGMLVGGRGKGGRIHCLADVPWLVSYGNSGALAIVLALYGGAERVLMLGFDCQKTGEKVHHFGDHPPGMGNALSMPQWPRIFKMVAKYASGRKVVNCTRQTVLTCFPRMKLEDALA